MLNQTIDLHLNRFGVPPVIHMVQNDTGRKLNMYTVDMELGGGETAELSIHRPDDSYYTVSCYVHGVEYYEADVTQALTRPGKVECQLKVTLAGRIMSTFTFYIMVQEAVDGLPVEQLGYDIYDLIDAASTVSSGLTDDIKQALLDCFAHVAWTDEHGQDYVDALEAALYPPAELASISAVYTQSGTVYTTDTLDSLKTNLVVTAHYTDSTTETVTTYTLSGTLTEGTSVITVTYEGKTTTFSVTVTAPATLSSISAVYTQSGTVYDTDSLDDLKSDLVVTAVYSDSTTETVASTDYTLSGTLTEGTSTITVSYGGKTTTFTVTVTHIQTSEVLSTFTSSATIDKTTFEDTSDSNNWVLQAGSLKASYVNLSWDTTECDLFQIWVAQYDSNSVPYKISAKNVYASNPITDGSQLDSWNNAGGNNYFTAIAGGNITISLPTSGVFKMSIRRASGAGSMVDSNATFGTWLTGGGVTITASITQGS